MSSIYTLCAAAFFTLGAWQLYSTTAEAVTGNAVVQRSTRAATTAVLWALGALALWGALSDDETNMERVLMIVMGTCGILLLVDELVVDVADRRRDPSREDLASNSTFVFRTAKKLFPCLAVLLLVRTYLVEPFLIPSDSMMPTLQEGDRILVQKYAYSFRLPLVDHPFYWRARPERGDVIVFRYPPDPRQTYVKRVVGLPGDVVEVRSDRVLINGAPLGQAAVARYSDGCYQDMTLYTATTGGHRHGTLACASSETISVRKATPSCSRVADTHYACRTDVKADAGDSKPVLVQDGTYFVIGDNRDNSDDSRVWGAVPEDLILGRTQRVWFSTTGDENRVVAWNRIGIRIP